MSVCLFWQKRKMAVLSFCHKCAQPLHHFQRDLLLQWFITTQRKQLHKTVAGDGIFSSEHDHVRSIFRTLKLAEF